MKLIASAAAAAALLSTSVLAAPMGAKHDTKVTDVDILQYALTLEHLENNFYKKGISMMNETDFTDAGFSTDYYNNLLYIVHDEESHVVLLTSAIKEAGATPVEACTYDFPFKDARSFVSLGSVLEGVGTAAYLGGAPLISNKDYLSVAGSILITEALHTAIQRFNLREVGPANPYGTALGLNEVFTLAATFIKSCPSSNPPLPVKAFPTLTATQGEPTAPDMTFTFSVSGQLPSTFFVTWVSGLVTTSVVPTVGSDGMITAKVPDNVQGQSYALITSANATNGVQDSMVLFGPAIVEVTPPSPTFDLSIQ